MRSKITWIRLVPVFLFFVQHLFGQGVASIPPRPVLPAVSVMPNWTDDFETEIPIWNVLHSENRGNLVQRERSANTFYRGKKSEFLCCDLPPNSNIIVGCPVDYPLVIDDLAPSLCVKSDQPGITIGVQVVLPNAIHPKTGSPITFLVPGTSYSGGRQWEKLGFLDKNGLPSLAKAIEQTAKFFRKELNTNLDLKDKYIRQVVLFIEGTPDSPTKKSLWIDSLEVAGHVATSKNLLDRFELALNVQRYRFDPINLSGFKIQTGTTCVYVQPLRAQNLAGYTDWNSPLETNTAIPLVPTPLSSVGFTGPYASNTLHFPKESPSGEAAQASSHHDSQRALYSEGKEVRYSLTNQQIPSEHEFSPASLMKIRLMDRVLLVDDVPIGVRAVEYRGEPLAFLRQLEFNTVWVKERPTPELLREAKNAGVWLICTPPGLSELESRTPDSSPSQEGTSSFLRTPLIDPIYDNILAWNLGDSCSNYEQPDYAKWAAVLQSADRGRRRPVVCTATSGVREYSRVANILMMRRQPILSSLEMGDLMNWEKTYPLLARPDTPFWCSIQTQPDPKLANQWTLFGGNPQDICAISYEQIKMQVYQAMASGSHGLLFNSNTPLTNNDPETEMRRTALELINWELQLIEEWFAAGRGEVMIVASNKPFISSAVIQSGRSRLLVPLWNERNSQNSIGAAVAGPVKYVVSGIPETYDAYHLTPGRLFPMDAPRVAGGVQVELPEANLNSLIYFGEDDPLYAKVGERAKKIGRRAAYLACHLADLQLASFEQVSAQLKQAHDLKAIPLHQVDKRPLITVQEQESMLRTTKEAINMAKQFAQQSPPAYAMSYLQAEIATRGLRVAARDILREATRFDTNPCMTPVSVSFATLPYFLSMSQRTLGAGLGPNRLVGGDMENIGVWKQAGWAPWLRKIEGVAPPILQLTPLAKHSGSNGMQMVVKPTSPEENIPQLETAAVWVMTPPVPVRMGEMICVNGWVRVPKTLESTVDGLMIFDSFAGEAQSLRFREAGPWKEFVFYRYAPNDGNYFVVFALHGFGEIPLDDVSIFPVQFDAMQNAPVQPQPPSQPPNWQQRLNPLQYIPSLPNWGNRQQVPQQAQ